MVVEENQYKCCGGGGNIKNLSRNEINESGRKRRGASVVSKILCLVPEKASLPSDSSICIIARHELVKRERLPFVWKTWKFLRRIRMERFIPMEIFREKSNTFRGITFFPFVPKRSKFSVPFVRTTSARLHVQRRQKIYRYFVNCTTQSRSCFRCQKNASTIRREIFTEISAKNGKRSGS